MRRPVLSAEIRQDGADSNRASGPPPSAGTKSSRWRGSRLFARSSGNSGANCAPLVMSTQHDPVGKAGFLRNSVTLCPFGVVQW